MNPLGNCSAPIRLPFRTSLRGITENPYNSAAPLNGIINSLMTELWTGILAKQKFGQLSKRPSRTCPAMPQGKSGEARCPLSWPLLIGWERETFQMPEYYIYRNAHRKRARTMTEQCL